MDDHYAISLAKTQLREAYNSADVNGILALFSDGFTDMRDGRPTFWGMDAKTALKATLEDLFLEHDIEWIPTIIDIAIRGDIAIDHGWHQITRRPKAGGPAEVTRSRYVEMWQRYPQEVWQIILFMDNLEHPPQFAERVNLP